MEERRSGFLVHLILFLSRERCGSWLPRFHAIPNSDAVTHSATPCLYRPSPRASPCLEHCPRERSLSRIHSFHALRVALFPCVPSRIRSRFAPSPSVGGSARCLAAPCRGRKRSTGTPSQRAHAGVPTRLRVASRSTGGFVIPHAPSTQSLRFSSPRVQTGLVHTGVRAFMFSSCQV